MCVCVCVCERERERDDSEYTENSKIILTRSKNRKLSQQVQREGENAYVVTFSPSSLTRTASWERDGDLTTYRICVIGY